MNRRRSLCLTVLAVWLAVAPAAAQDPQPTTDPASSPEAPASDATLTAHGTDSAVDDLVLPLQQYADPSGRFGFAAPSRWGRLASSSPDEVTFESESGDSIRVSVAPLKVDAKAFTSAYVDTYLKVLAQTFTDVKFIGQREVTLSFRKATDYVFSAHAGDTPVSLHQLVLLGTDKVLYITFAGFGQLRTQAEQLYHTTVQSLWVSSAFGGSTATALSDPNAPAYVLAIPEGWVDQGPGDGNSYMFRPPNARPTAAFISTRVAKLQPADPHRAVDDAFVASYTDVLKSQHEEGPFEVRQTRRIFLGGEPAVRYDYTYVSNFGIRRAILVLCVRREYLVGVSCDSAEQSYSMYDQAFESLVSGFKFKP